MDLAYELHDLVRTLDRWAERMLRPAGLSYSRYVALVIVCEHPGLTGRDLARGLGVSEAAASGLVKALLRDELVENVAGEGAGNVRRLRATEAGRATQQRCAELLGDSLDRNARAIGIDPAQLALTVRALHDEVRTTRTDSSSEDPS